MHILIVIALMLGGILILRRQPWEGGVFKYLFHYIALYQELSTKMESGLFKIKVF